MGESLSLPEFTWFMNSGYDHLVDHYLFCGREVRRAVEAYDPWGSERFTYYDTVFLPTDMWIPSKGATRNDISYDAMMRNEILRTLGFAGMEEFSILGMSGYDDNTILRHEIKQDSAHVGVCEFRRFVRDDGSELIVSYERDPTRTDTVGEMRHCLRVMTQPVGILVADAYERMLQGLSMEAELGTHRQAILKMLWSHGWTGDSRFMTVRQLTRELIRHKRSGRGQM